MSEINVPYWKYLNHHFISIHSFVLIFEICFFIEFNNITTKCVFLFLPFRSKQGFPNVMTVVLLNQAYNARTMKKKERTYWKEGKNMQSLIGEFDRCKSDKEHFYSG